MKINWTNMATLALTNVAMTLGLLALGVTSSLALFLCSFLLGCFWGNLTGLFTVVDK